MLNYDKLKPVKSFTIKGVYSVHAMYTMGEISINKHR